MTTLDDTRPDDGLEDQIRRTLRAVADTVDGDGPGMLAAPGAPVGHRRRSRLAVAIAAVVLLLGLGVAWQRLGQPGQIARIPTEDAVMSGSATEGGEWWLIPSSSVHPSLPRCPGVAVDFVSAAANLPAREWNTGGVGYGEPSSAPSGGCPDVTAWLATPARYAMGSTRLGPSADGGDPSTAWGVYGAFHPDVDHLDVSIDGHPPTVVDTVELTDRPGGPRVAAFIAPADAHEATLTLLDVHGEVLTRGIWRS